MHGVDLFFVSVRVLSSGRSRKDGRPVRTLCLPTPPHLDRSGDEVSVDTPHTLECPPLSTVNVPPPVVPGTSSHVGATEVGCWDRETHDGNFLDPVLQTRDSSVKVNRFRPLFESFRVRSS